MTLDRYIFLAELLVFFSLLTLAVISLCVFFDHAVWVRKETIFRVTPCRRKVALTFDDGPSHLWTPPILDALKKLGIKATFFMVGSHVQKFPEIARRVAQEGHTIGNHGYAHSVFLYYTEEELEEEIKYTELMIRQITGQTTRYFRPPKAWLTKQEKRNGDYGKNSFHLLLGHNKSKSDFKQTCREFKSIIIFTIIRFSSEAIRGFIIILSKAKSGT